jgi:hypothetical protein
MTIEPRATICSIMKGAGNNYRLMPNIFRENDPLPEATKHRYCLEYWERIGGPYRFSAAQYKTQGDLDHEKEEVEAKIPKIVVEQGNLTWTQEEALQYLEEKAKAKPKLEQAKPMAKPERKEKTIDEIYYATMARAEKELPKPKPAEPPVLRPQPFDAEADRRMNEGLRARLLTGRKPQDPVYPPLPREMTAEEEARYWWGKAREGMSR